MGHENCIAPPAGISDDTLKQWQNDMICQGFNLTVKELTEKLKVTTAYVSTNISSNVPHIKCTGYSDTTGKYNGNILLSRTAVYNWLYEHSTFTRKTVWLNPYKLGLPDEQVTRYLEEYKQARKDKIGASASGTIIKHKAEDYYERELELNQELMLKLGIPVCEVHERKRFSMAEFQVDKLHYMNGYELKFNKDFTDVNQCHRHMFRNAAIKILISTSNNAAANPTAKNRGKVLFIEQTRPVGTNAILYPAEIAYKNYPDAVYPLKHP